MISPAVWPQEDSMGKSSETENARQPVPGFASSDDLQRALIETKRILEVAEKQLLLTDTKLIAYTFDYGKTLLRAGEQEESRRVLTLALSRGVDAFGAKSEEIVPVLISLADANAGLGNLKAQRKYLYQGECDWPMFGSRPTGFQTPSTNLLISSRKPFNLCQPRYALVCAMPNARE